MIPTVLEADVQGGASDPRPDIFQRVSKFQSTSPMPMWFVDHMRIGGASAQSLGVDTRSPNGDDHWWDTHGKREKQNQRRHTANFISASSFPPIRNRHRNRTVGFFRKILTKPVQFFYRRCTDMIVVLLHLFFHFSLLIVVAHHKKNIHKLQQTCFEIQKEAKTSNMSFHTSTKAECLYRFAR